jgi:deazaflavin-dependent oxidoreductase (nitroreductase family)
MSQDTQTTQTPQSARSSQGGNAGRSLQHAFTEVHVWLYRRTGGAIGGRMGGHEILILTTTGRKSGKKRDTPLQYTKDGERFIIIASNGGASKHPTWFLNLRANPEAQLQIRAKTIAVEASEAIGEERERLWTQVTSQHQNFADYQKRTTREIPVVVLTPVVR